MEVFDAIANTLRLLKNRPKLVLPIFLFIAIVALVEVVIIFSFIAGNSHPLALKSGLGASIILSLLTSSAPYFIILIIAILLIAVFFQGAYIYLCSKWNSPKASLLDAFNYSTKVYINLLLFVIIQGIISIIIFAIFILPVALTAFHSVIVPYLNGAAIPPASVGGLIILAIGMVILSILASIMVAVLLFVGPSIVALERKGPIAALKRSIDIGKRNAVNIFVLMVANFLILIAFLVIISIISIIPLIGPIIVLLLDGFIVAYSMMLPTMYYVLFCKK